jgi:calcineurin-like phosphoesterase family protein
MTQKTFITSDLHFGHGNMLKFNPETRQFKDADHMNAMMIAEWNETVGPEDLTYILGDFAFLHANKATAIAHSLNGRKILIEGNHDKKLLTQRHFRDCFEEVHLYHEINFDGIKVCMFHYPVAEWNQCHRGAVMFHGHVHAKPTGLEKFRSRDVGMDATGRVVVEMSEMVRRACLGELKVHGTSKE